MATPSIGYYGEKLNLLIRQGATLGDFVVTVRNPDQSVVDLTGSTIRGQIRKKALDASVVKALTCTVDPDQVGAGKGKFKFGLTDEETATITAGELPTDAASIYVWDIEWEDAAGGVTPLFYGACTVLREVTRP